MIIAKKRIIKLPVLLTDNNNYYIAVKATADNLKKLNVDNFENGKRIEPSPNYGPNCKNNLYAHYKTIKGKIKERRYVSTVPYELTKWNGDTVTGYTDIYKDCYPREKIEPYGIILNLFRDDQHGTDLIIAKTHNQNELKNTINIFLEVFKHCEVLDENLNLTFNAKNYTNINWVILPPDTKDEILNIIAKNKEKKQNDKTKKFVKARLDELEKYKPLQRAIGINGLDGYLAFIYKDICIFENPFLGNATYVVNKENWEEASKLTKTQLMKSNLFIERIEHRETWFNSITKLFSKKS